MEPIKFPQHNIVYAENQKEYRPLPAYRDENVSISCWKLTWKERLKILFGKPLWLHQMNFGQALQPQLPTTESPFKKTEVSFSFSADMNLNIGRLNRFDIIKCFGWDDKEFVITKKEWHSSKNATIYTFVCVPENELTRWQKFIFKNKKKLIYHCP